jgi:RNA polymerase-binding transcription factor DksA
MFARISVLVYLDMEHSSSNLQAQLQAEHDALVSELSGIAVLNPETGDWEVRLDDLAHETTEVNTEADGVEDATERAATVAALETTYRTVLLALKKITDGTYGICEISGEAIESDRLNANPSARTCKAHMNEESTLPQA